MAHHIEVLVLQDFEYCFKRQIVRWRFQWPLSGWEIQPSRHSLSPSRVYHFPSLRYFNLPFGSRQELNIRQNPLVRPGSNGATSIKLELTLLLDALFSKRRRLNMILPIINILSMCPHTNCALVDKTSYQTLVEWKVFLKKAESITSPPPANSTPPPPPQALSDRPMCMFDEILCILLVIKKRVCRNPILALILKQRNKCTSIYYVFPGTHARIYSLTVKHGN